MRDFQELALAVSSKYRCIQSSPGRWNLPLEYCFFGVPQEDFFGWTLLDRVPKNLKGAHFYLGGECAELISSFANSEHSQSIERLAIGNSSFAVGSGLDYTSLIKEINGIRFPCLKVLELGVWELFSNSHCMYGTLGEITQVLTNIPQIENIGLYGYFELNEAVNLETLKSLTVRLDDYTTGANGGFINHSTLKNLLESDCPNLEKMFIDLECEDNQYGYYFPEKFLKGENMPKLKKLEITGGFLSGEKERLLKSPIGTRSDVIYRLGDMSG